MKKEMRVSAFEHPDNSDIIIICGLPERKCPGLQLGNFLDVYWGVGPPVKGKSWRLSGLPCLPGIHS